MVLASEENHSLADHSAAEKGAGNVALTELPRAETVDAIEALLPGKLDKDQIRIG